MNRRARFLAVLSFLMMAAMSASAFAAEMTFQFVNDSEYEMNLKLFARGDSGQQWPSKTRAYSLRPDAAVQEVKISCETGEQICWGAWATVKSEKGGILSNGQRENTRITKSMAGVGDRGQFSCDYCCHICTDGAVTPMSKLHRPQQSPRPDPR